MVALLIETIRQWPETIVFLENYDMALGRLLTRGCDVWLNTPRRPMEASGTSGMKAAMNGTLNLSILDGWWPEGCEHGVTGWAIGDETVEPDAVQDDRDLKALYATLERDVVPALADPAALGPHDARLHPDGRGALLLGPHGHRVFCSPLLRRPLACRGDT